MPRTPKLLISVRDAREIGRVLNRAVDILDLKEPRLGPLAPTSPEFWTQAVSLVTENTSTELSVALGERDEAVKIAGLVPEGIGFAKAGPGGCSAECDLTDLWSRVRYELPSCVELVAVAYADAGAAGSVSPIRVFQLAAQFGLRRCLIDTFTKDGRSTWDHLGPDGLLELQASARDSGLSWVLAGSIQRTHCRKIWDAGIFPDCFGVRGDICDGGRTTGVSPGRVADWQGELAEWSLASCGPPANNHR